MAVKTKPQSPVRTGTAVLSTPIASGESPMLTVSPDTHVDAVPFVSMDQLISIDQHAIWLDAGNSPIFPCISSTAEECPACQLGDKARFRGFLPVMTEEGAKVFPFGIQMARSLNDIDEAVGGIKGQVLRIKRTGTGMATRWTAIATGKTKTVDDADAPDVLERLGPQTRDEILDLLFEANIEIEGILTKKEAVRFASAGASTEDSEPEESEEGWSEV